jgi:hypothetical protein
VCRVSRGDGELPITLRVAIWVLFVEAVGVGVVAVMFAYAGATQRVVSVGSAVTVVLYPAGIAVLLGLFGWLLSRRRAWARGPAIVLELLFVPIGYYLVTGGVAWLGIPVIVLGLGCAGLLLAPASRAALGIR